MRGLSIWCRIYLGLATFSVVGSAFSRWSGLDPGPIKSLAAALTLLLGVAAVFEPYFAERGPKRALLCLGTIFLVGAVAEIVGICTGWPFGQYAYTDQWWPTILLPGGHLYPLLVPFAWTLIVGGVYTSANPWRAILLGALAATVVDMVSEGPMTLAFRYWKWDHPELLGAPMQNYVGWFAVSASSLGLVWVLGIRPTDRKEPRVVVLAHVCMVLLIAQIAYR